MVGKKYWYIMYYITYQYFTLDIKFASGIEPGSPASQVGTLPKELCRQLILSVECASHLTAREG
jgi:hypothetical protein